MRINAFHTVQGGNLLLASLAVLFLFLFSCNDALEKKVSDQRSLRHSSTINNGDEQLNAGFQDTARHMLNEKWGPYFSKEFDSTAQVYIDTFLISPDSARVVFFAIVKYAGMQQASAGVDDQHKFDASCFLGQKSEVGVWRIAWFDAENFSSYRDVGKIRQRIRIAYFRDLKKREAVDGSSLYKFNLDEPEFWTGPVWDMYFK